MKLYDIAEIYENLENIDDDVAVSAAMDSVDAALEEKLESTAKVIRNLEAEAEALEAEEKRLKARKMAVKNRIADIKGYVQQNLEAMGKDKVTSGIFKWSIQANAPSVNILDEDLIPDAYWKIERKPMKTEIKKAIEAGELTEGAELVRTKSLRLR
ncbi:siphovirus Gp157 family protein [Aedoeadaptatus acetigenes]|uniref:siphovirus Gp157 family protein n=1 Tax=Aedoeadaptatus acetigenes TaxID=2981723 RepID=UPI0011DDAE28|nr:siphovirus Gp157 family protein [Aedoeadaptatus acetigenes]MCU6786383.1 siphovirus Gp157 family protein [Aedoeadaptatus acetigenes]